jgi:hypothetical protein
MYSFFAKAWRGPVYVMEALDSRRLLSVSIDGDLAAVSGLAEEEVILVDETIPEEDLTYYTLDFVATDEEVLMTEVDGDVPIRMYKGDGEEYEAEILTMAEEGEVLVDPMPEDWWIYASLPPEASYRNLDDTEVVDPIDGWEGDVEILTFGGEGAADGEIDPQILYMTGGPSSNNITELPPPAQAGSSFAGADSLGSSILGKSKDDLLASPDDVLA